MEWVFTLPLRGVPVFSPALVTESEELGLSLQRALELVQVQMQMQMQLQ